MLKTMLKVMWRAGEGPRIKGFPSLLYRMPPIHSS